MAAVKQNDWALRVADESFRGDSDVLMAVSC